MPIQPGVKLGAYEIQDYVGRGAMGVVFRAYHEGLARMGAVKELQVLAPDPDASARFQREAQAIAQMRHPNILNVSDFGLAKLLAASSVKTMSGAPIGTPAYMAPEQVVGGAIGPASDRYALATMAYEMLAGAVPFEGDNVLEVLYAHVHREPPPASSRNKELGPAVDAVLSRGLDKDP